MRVWLLQISEPLPIDGPQVRLLRTAVLAEHLLAKGHEVVWWSGAFDHVNKRHRVRRSVKIPLWDKGELYLLASCGYRKNVSLWRVLDHFQVAREFAKLAPRETAPEVIVASLPTPDLCAAAAKYATDRGIPLILDLRDEWPDLFLDFFPRFFRKLGRFFLRRLFRCTSYACQAASGLVGATPKLLEWGLRYAKRAAGAWDRVFLLGYHPRVYSIDARKEAENFWKSRGISDTSDFINICFFGTLGRQFVLEPVIKTAREIESEGWKVRWILCGTGDLREKLQGLAAGLHSVYFPGWQDEVRIQELIRISHLGLAPYQRRENFLGAFPNKVAEYLAGGLPLVSTLVGGLDRLLDKYRCGWTYEPLNVNQLVGLVREIIQHKDRLAEMREGAKKLFAEYFDAEKIYPAYVNYIEEVAQKFRVKRLAA